jgi:CHAD domain-containing protein
MLSAWRELAQGRQVTDGDGEPANAARPIAETAGDRIARVYRHMVRDGRKIDDDSHPEELHDLRKRGKELRYLLELFGSAFPADVVDPAIAELKRLQEILGRFQDRSVQIEALHGHRHELAAEPEGPAALIALGPALEALRADQAAARAEFAERFARFSAKQQRKRIRGAFATAAR